MIDFGSASRIPENESSYFTLFNGTLHFASPEYVKHIPVKGPEAEVWTMGVVLYTIVFGENPFHTTEDVLKYNIKFPEENTGKYSICTEIIIEICRMFGFNQKMSGSGGKNPHNFRWYQETSLGGDLF